MKILQVVHGFPPNSNAGAEKYTYFLTHELSKRHDVHVLYPVIGNASLTINSHRSGKIHFHELSVFESTENWLTKFLRVIQFENTFTNNGLNRVFKNFIATLKPDIIHFQHLLYMSAGFISVADGLGIPTVLTLHDYWFMCPVVQLFKGNGEVCGGPLPYICKKCWTVKQALSLSARLNHHAPSSITQNLIKLLLTIFNFDKEFQKRTHLMKRLLLQVDKVIAPSQFLKNVFINYGVQKADIIYSENGYDGKILGLSQKKQSKGPVIFGFIGRVVREKGVHTLVDAFQKIPKGKAILKIYGGYDADSIYVKQILNKISRQDNIEMLGETNDIDRAYQEIDVLVFPSIWYENCPLVLAERKLKRIPVIASDIGAVPEFVRNGEDGLLFKANNFDDLQSKMMMFIQNPALIEIFADNINEYPKTIEEQSVEFEGIYAKVIKQSKPAASTW